MHAIQKETVHVSLFTSRYMQPDNDKESETHDEFTALIILILLYRV